MIQNISPFDEAHNTAMCLTLLGYTIDYLIEYSVGAGNFYKVSNY